jgi:hypothetical protein
MIPTYLVVHVSPVILTTPSNPLITAGTELSKDMSSTLFWHWRSVCFFRTS